jgi:hypothetical protein
MQIKNFDLALKSFEVAEHLNFEPASKLHYKIACANNWLQNNNDEWSVMYHLQIAFDKGFRGLSI